MRYSETLQPDRLTDRYIRGCIFTAGLKRLPATLIFMVSSLNSLKTDDVSRGIRLRSFAHYYRWILQISIAISSSMCPSAYSTQKLKQLNSQMTRMSYNKPIGGRIILRHEMAIKFDVTLTSHAFAPSLVNLARSNRRTQQSSNATRRL